MKQRILILMVWAAVSCLSGVSAVFAQGDDMAEQESLAQARPKTDMTHNAGDSIVRYDIIDVAKNMMSCAAYYDLFDDNISGDGFIDEVKWMFMVDASQTDEETASWIATAGGIYSKYWTDMQNDDSFEIDKKIEQQRIECHNLGVARKIFSEGKIEQVK